MVKDFCWFNACVSIPVSLEYPIDLRKNASEESVRQYRSHPSRTGISWKYNEDEIVLEDPLGSVKGFPTTNLKYVVAIYYGINGKYKPPGNAVLYRPDGTVHRILQMPQLLSTNITELLTFLKIPNPPLQAAAHEGGLQFNGFGWKQEFDGRLLDTISILYDREWWESRELDPETGEIGRLLNSGRL